MMILKNKGKIQEEFHAEARRRRGAKEKEYEDFTQRRRGAEDAELSYDSFS